MYLVFSDFSDLEILEVYRSRMNVWMCAILISRIDLII